MWDAANNAACWDEAPQRLMLRLPYSLLNVSRFISHLSQLCIAAARRRVQLVSLQGLGSHFQQVCGPSSEGRTKLLWASRCTCNVPSCIYASKKPIRQWFQMPPSGRCCGNWWIFITECHKHLTTTLEAVNIFTLQSFCKSLACWCLATVCLIKVSLVQAQ